MRSFVKQLLNGGTQVFQIRKARARYRFAEATAHSVVVRKRSWESSVQRKAAAFHRKGARTLRPVFFRGVADEILPSVCFHRMAHQKSVCGMIEALPHASVLGVIEDQISVGAEFDPHDRFISPSLKVLFLASKSFRENFKKAVTS